jgi:energy-coupling factor transporter ATP-binding protein EcfA2
MTAMSTPAIEILGLTKDYPVGFWRKRARRSLDNLTLQVEDGEVLGFLGPNGAGKTTTLKLLMGLTFPTSGTARIRGRSIEDVGMHREIGYLPEQPYFYDYLSARELLDYYARFFGYDAASAASAWRGSWSWSAWRRPRMCNCENSPRECCSERESRKRSCTIPRLFFSTSPCPALTR